MNKRIYRAAVSQRLRNTGLNHGVECWWRNRSVWHCIFPKISATCLNCGTVVAVLWMCLWKSRVRLMSHSSPLKDTLFFRFLHVPCTVRQPAKSTFTWPLICSPQKYMWSGCSKTTSNWRISSGTCLLQNSCNMRHTAISVILYLNTSGLCCLSVKHRYTEFLLSTYGLFSF